MNSYNLEMTSDPSLEKDPQYKAIKENLLLLFKTSGHQFFFGNCVSTCDIIQNILSQVGIKTRIIECQVAATKTNPDGSKQYYFIGYDDQSYSGQIDTHTIIVTETAEPILIDVSIGHVFLPHNKIIIEKVNRQSGDNFAEYSFGGVTINYKEKRNLKLPGIHQKNLIQRLITEQNIEKTVKSLKLFVICAVTLGLVNFTLNITLIILRLFNIQWVE